MKTISLNDLPGDWRALVREVERAGDAVLLELDGAVCGALLPAREARRLAARFAPAEPDAAARQAATWQGPARNYLEMLRDDPALVPAVGGQPLEFVTMMNSSYIDPQQLYQFRHPKTGQIYVYRAGELQQAIGRAFVSVDRIPDHPKDFVAGKR
ncbi:MAG: hypothetical protein IPO81_19860 [Kouleothrix sp.]|nr:hypothetical protein [Kouleothrix sp.]